jgi:hypothetical protein
VTIPAKTRRQAVATALVSCSSDEWISMEALFTTMRRGHMSPTVARSEMALWKLYLVDAHYGSLGYDGFHRWEILEGRYTLAVLFEYAGTLGLFDLDYIHPSGARDDFHNNWGGGDLDALSRYDGLQAVRLTALGRYALGLTDTYQPPAGDRDTQGFEGSSQSRHRRHRSDPATEATFGVDDLASNPGCVVGNQPCHEPRGVIGHSPAR